MTNILNLYLFDLENPFALLVVDVGIIFGTLGVIFFRKIIYSALFLGLVFGCVALLYLLLHADFLAAAQILIYVGAVSILILFAIMLINNQDLGQNLSLTLGNVIASISSIGLFFILINNIFNTSWKVIPSVPNSSSNVQIIGYHLFTDLLVPFELLSLLLLIALIGAITIARKDKYIPF